MGTVRLRAFASGTQQEPHASRLAPAPCSPPAPVAAPAHPPVRPGVVQVSYRCRHRTTRDSAPVRAPSGERPLRCVTRRPPRCVASHSSLGRPSAVSQRTTAAFFCETKEKARTVGGERLATVVLAETVQAACCSCSMTHRSRVYAHQTPPSGSTSFEGPVSVAGTHPQRDCLGTGLASRKTRASCTEKMKGAAESTSAPPSRNHRGPQTKMDLQRPSTPSRRQGTRRRKKRPPLTRKEKDRCLTVWSKQVSSRT